MTYLAEDSKGNRKVITEMACLLLVQVYGWRYCIRQPGLDIIQPTPKGKGK